MIDQRNIETIARHYGTNTQALQTIEECAELIQALHKLYRADTYQQRLMQKVSIIEEIADVEIMLTQMKLLLEIDEDELDEIKKEKITRQIRRICDGEGQGTTALCAGDGTVTEDCKGAGR